ncbi:FlgO family outer membrane protein [Ferrimonas sp. SCSIO 43195]|uniref:FlgO family outer membrane protein n=1 Tax=Ferrimonas sp. SCSIO 43195 TaxID=2822844 RepID=UPI0020760A5F|nr:FlgO family outer membrane protein [Ferrimonas sp. SCSIO 43195]USD38599.1 hypothetical protein J8Z22_05700 [Ferrimonas sp. SCSIO 43195]
MKAAIGVLFLLLTACAAPPEPPLPDYSDSGKGLPHSSALIHLSARIAEDLERNHDLLNKRQLIAVTTPVWLNNINASGRLPRQLGEGLLSALHQRGFNLVELNSSKQIRVSEQGNLILSRDYQRLEANLPVNQVLVATLSQDSDGVIINTRLVDIANNRVVSTSQAFLSWQESAGYLEPSYSVTEQQGQLIRDEQPGRTPVREVTP